MIAITWRFLLLALSPGLDGEHSGVGHHTKAEDDEQDVSDAVPVFGGDGAVVHKWLGVQSVD